METGLITSQSEYDWNTGLNVDWRLSNFDDLEIQGFNAAAGLPRSPALAIKRGSVFVFRKSNQEAFDVLKGWLVSIAESESGLGERTEEGFGQFLVDFNFHRDPIGNIRKALDEPPPAQVAWCESEIIMMAAGEIARAIKKLSKTQLQSLRSCAQSALHETRTTAKRVNYIEDWFRIRQSKTGDGKTDWSHVKSEFESIANKNRQMFTESIDKSNQELELAIHELNAIFVACQIVIRKADDNR